MPIVMISSAPQSGCETLAASLAEKTGWPLSNRQELQEAARKFGLKVGRLEIAMIKSPKMHEKLAREKDLYLAFITAALGEKAPEGNLIYEGRTGHLLLPGVTHRLRVGLVAPMEIRTRNAMQSLNLSHDKAHTYLDHLDEDIEKWVRYVHRHDLKELSQYDFVINLHNMKLSNATQILLSMAGLPEFQPTKASLKLVQDHLLASRAKLRLAFDERSRNADLRVKADSGVLTVTYMPRQEEVADAIPKVLHDLEGCRRIECTMAETNILWVQEAFDPEVETFEQINQLAQRWGAAVELLRLAPASDTGSAGTLKASGKREREETAAAIYDGGVEDDVPDMPQDGGMNRTLEDLVARGRSGGGHTVHGDKSQVIEAMKGNGQNALVVLGDLFLSKGHETRKRQTRELALEIRERLKTPVITADELQARFLFGKRQAFKTLFFAALAVCIYTLAFSNQQPILDFMGGDFHAKYKWLTSLGVFLFVPFVAYTYGTVTGLLLKLIGID